MRKIFFTFFLLFSLVTANASERMIAVTILPQKFITEKIVGNLWTVISIIPEGANPHTYEPKINTLKNVSAASAYLSLEEVLDEIWVKKILDVNPKIKIYRMDKGVEKLRMSDDDHHHGKKLFHDPHIWLSLENMKIIAQNTKDILLSIDPANKTSYEKNYEQLVKEIDMLKNEVSSRLITKKNKSFLVFHPAWGYFARDFGLNQVSIEFEGKEPSPKRLKEIISFAKSKNIKVIFVQPQISSTTVETLAKELGARIVKINPLEYDWLKNMKYVSQEIADGLE
ncbi:MAG: metal ABC transporter solute-binding protein, Zn/Mn family [Calditerrivibrio sp.]|uniref:metal ABC transporter solute-binding protein, Zn/Mn family n=1 Tax=Calditerrivibrio sp. TaxID=2792612 RepID=UPI003D0DB22A